MTANGHSPLVSAIIPVRNCERYLAEAIDSVLHQKGAECEIIVVDDGSTDATPAVAHRYGSRVQYRRQAHAGAGAARNLGAAEASGRYLAFLDADDLWTESKLETQLACFDAHPELDIVFGHVQQGYSPELDPDTGRRLAAAEILPGFLPSSMLAKRESFFRVGPFDASGRLGEGIDWYLRAADLGLRMVMLPDLVLWRRVHRTNVGVLRRDDRRDYLHVVKAALDRRRREATGDTDSLFPTTPREPRP